MKKVISFSLWGENPKYTIGAIKNAELVNKIYPSWIGRFYVGKSVPEKILIELKSIPNTEIISLDENGDWTGMFWRFFACEDSDIMLSRDTDSRLNLREKLAVDEWLNSEKNFHIMRDHPWHSTQILGGMWGCRNGILKGITQKIKEFNKRNFYQVDQHFLRDIIYPNVLNDSLIHDSYFNFETIKKNFPNERVNKEFVGDVFDEFDNRHPDYYKLL
jgi:hypothetical protein